MEQSKSDSPQQLRVRELLIKAWRKFGSQRALARKCSVTQQTISKAIQHGHVSMELAMAVHRATGGEIDRVELCPELRDYLSGS